MARRQRNQPLADAFGDRVRSARSAKGYSQEHLAELSGVHRTYIGHVENGRVMPSLDTVAMISNALGTTMSDLLAGLSVAG